MITVITRTACYALAEREGGQYVIIDREGFPGDRGVQRCYDAGYFRRLKPGTTLEAAFDEFDRMANGPSWKGNVGASES